MLFGGSDEIKDLAKYIKKTKFTDENDFLSVYRELKNIDKELGSYLVDPRRVGDLAKVLSEKLSKLLKDKQKYELYKKYVALFIGYFIKFSLMAKNIKLIVDFVRDSQERILDVLWVFDEYVSASPSMAEYLAFLADIALGIVDSEVLEGSMFVKFLPKKLVNVPIKKPLYHLIG